MKTPNPLAAMVVLAACTVPVYAFDSTSQIIRRHAPAGITTAFYTCIDNADSNTIASAACLTDEQIRQDKRLNTAYKILLGKLRPEEKRELMDAERAWLKFRKSNGIFESSIYGNDVIDNLEQSQNEVFALCERADALEKYLDIVAHR